MKVIPYDDTDTERTIRLQLEGQRDKHTSLIVVDRNGQWVRNLLTISPHGITRSPSIGPDLGFPLDDKGRIIIHEGH